MNDPSDQPAERADGYELDLPEAAPAKPKVESKPLPTAAPAAKPVEPAEAARPLVQTARFDLPLLGAGVAAALFAVACLAGFGPLFPDWTFANADTDVWIRVNVAVRGLLLMAISTACLLAGLVIVVFLDGRPTGDVRVVTVRCAMIAAVALLGRAVPMPWAFLKATWDVAGPLAIAFLLLIGLFRLKAKDATTALGASLIALVLLSIASMLVNFATGAPAGPAEQAQRSTIP